MSETTRTPDHGTARPPAASRTDRAVTALRISVTSNPAEWLMALAFTALCVGLFFFAPFFATTQNVNNILQRGAPVAIIAIGQTFVILTRGIDLSVGSVYALTGVTGALAMGSWGVVPGIAVALAVGLGAGIVNGLFVSYLRIAPFVVTLAMLALARSWTNLSTDGEAVTDVPASFNWLGNGSVLGIPAFVILLVVLYVVAHAVLRHSRLGRFVYAIGNNPEAARLAGVDVQRYLVVPYALSGTLAGVATLISVSRLGSVDTEVGTGLELDVIAAVVIGGTSLFGGRGTLVGTAIGAFFVATLATGLNLLDVSSFWQGTATGGVLLVAVALQSTISLGRFGPAQPKGEASDPPSATPGHRGEGA